jgi:Ca-activated chloride channel family protein
LGKLYAYIFITGFLLSLNYVYAQNNSAFKPSHTRILFLLDASGSMKEKWNDKTKYEISKELIYHLVDSLQTANPEVEVGIRIYGHQYPRAVHNCTDSKLEIPFAKNNAEKIKQVLDKITPQGYTPIALSLLEAAKDFSYDTTALNAIVLVTDGEEMCEGNPCDATKELIKKRIAIKPFIIGLNIAKDVVIDFNCVGNYYDAKDENSFYRLLKNVTDQALKNTTLQINLLDIKNQPTISNIAFTLYDHYSGAIKYNFIHTLNEQNNPDTLYINPAGTYDIEVHSIPPVKKYKIELVAGTHNIIPIEMPIGYLKLAMENKKSVDNIPCVIREAYSSEILYVQDLNDNEAYIRGDFDIDFLTLPRYTKKLVYVPEEKEKEMTIPKSGKVLFMNVDASIASIYEIKQGEFKMLYEFDKVKEKDELELLPGRYAVVMRPKSAPKTDFTKTIYFDIQSEKTTNVNLR